MQTETQLAIDLSVISEIRISYRNPVKPSLRPKINDSRDVYELFLASWDTGTLELYETFKIMLLNRANRVLGICTISTGGINAAVVDAKLVFGTALRAAASGIILCHNHPSGNLQPSENDRKITQKLRKGGELLDIAVLDHLIVTSEGYYSFGDEGRCSF